MSIPRSKVRPLRVLLTEGTSTSAREAVTLLGLAGHHVEICDPTRLPLARLSRFVRVCHRCPGLRRDPLGFLAFIERLLERRYDVLLPIHEQGLLLSKMQPRFKGRVGLALPLYKNYRLAHGKAGFSRVLAELGLPQPATQIVGSLDDLRAAASVPCVIKTAIGTASRGVWLVTDQAGLGVAIAELAAADWSGEVLVQDFVTGATEKAQSVFCRGKLVGFHAYRQIMEGAGGGDAVKRSVIRTRVRDDLAAIGERLAWHGALSIDFIMPEDGSGPLYIDCNPRLVEPMAAYLAGTDLVDLLLRVSLGEAPQARPDGRADVTSRQAMQALLGSALRGGSRRDLLTMCCDIIRRRGAFADSVEELTPVRLDWMSAVPLIMTAAMLLANPRLARLLVTGGWGAHLLDADSIATIDSAAIREEENIVH